MSGQVNQTWSILQTKRPCNLHKTWSVLPKPRSKTNPKACGIQPTSSTLQYKITWATFNTIPSYWLVHGYPYNDLILRCDYPYTLKKHIYIYNWVVKSVVYSKKGGFWSLLTRAPVSMLARGSLTQPITPDQAGAKPSPSFRHKLKKSIPMTCSGHGWTSKVELHWLFVKDIK